MSYVVRFEHTFNAYGCEDADWDSDRTDSYEQALKWAAQEDPRKYKITIIEVHDIPMIDDVLKEVRKYREAYLKEKEEQEEKSRQKREKEQQKVRRKQYLQLKEEFEKEEG